MDEDGHKENDLIVHRDLALMGQDCFLLARVRCFRMVILDMYTRSGKYFCCVSFSLTYRQWNGTSSARVNKSIAQRC